ncbi:zinc ribbon domain-containing protein [Bacteroides sedimenti]|uniref:DZANK-type domain-containing protein n=1 Tax=Bacteroides sedimenti TaxID=2136147 RepID=A0ABM8IG75_9BACE
MALIKCPECGESVSDKAAACPHCGIAISGNIIKCPECGEYVFADLTSCPKCAFPLKDENNVENEDTVTLNLYDKKKDEPKSGITLVEVEKLFENKQYIPAFEKINAVLSVTPYNEEYLKLKTAIIYGLCNSSLDKASELLQQKKYTEALSEVHSALRYAPHSNELKIMADEINRAKSRRRIKITTIVVVLVVAAISGIAFSAYNYNLKSNEEEAWSVAKDSATVTSLQRYMEDYPGGEHAFEAEKMLMQLKQADTDYWENIKQSGDVAKFEEYKSKFPQGQYLAQANSSIDSLDWIKASRINTSEAYASYLSAHPQGFYSSEALSAQNKIASMAPSEEDIEVMKSYFSNYYTAVVDKDDDALLEFFEPVTRQYYGLANAKKGDILSNLKKMHSKDNRELNIKINDDDFKVTKDENENYNVSFTIDVNYGQDDATTGTTTAMAVNAVVNSNKKIVSITSKKQN